MSPSPSALASPACKALTASTAAASLFRTIISTLSYGYVATGGRVPSLWRAGGPGRSSHGRSVGRPAVNSRRDWHVIKNPSSASVNRSEEHSSELQSRGQLVCRLLLEQKKHHITTKWNN